jgi:hypothetical protein
VLYERNMVDELGTATGMVEDVEAGSSGSASLSANADGKPGHRLDRLGAHLRIFFGAVGRAPFGRAGSTDHDNGLRRCSSRSWASRQPDSFLRRGILVAVDS